MTRMWWCGALVSSLLFMLAPAASATQSYYCTEFFNGTDRSSSYCYNSANGRLMYQGTAGGTYGIRWRTTSGSIVRDENKANVLSTSMPLSDRYVCVGYVDGPTRPKP